MFDNRTLVTRKFDLENVTITDMNPNQLPVVFMADGEGGTAHSAVVSKDENDNSERMIWTIIINSIGRERLAKLIPDYEKWLKEDIIRYAKGEKREATEAMAYLSRYSIDRID